jgi:hypothetical protein
MNYSLINIYDTWSHISVLIVYMLPYCHGPANRSLHFFCSNTSNLELKFGHQFSGTEGFIIHTFEWQKLN